MKASPPVAASPPVDPRIYLAAERTLLAWVRTSVSLMGFGLIVAKLRWLLEGLGVAAPTRALRQIELSGRLGLVLVLLGVAVLAAAATRHFLYVRALDRLGPGAPVRRNFGVIVACVLAVTGLVLAVILGTVD